MLPNIQVKEWQVGKGYELWCYVMDTSTARQKSYSGNQWEEVLWLR